MRHPFTATQRAPGKHPPTPSFAVSYGDLTRRSRDRRTGRHMGFNRTEDALSPGRESPQPQAEAKAVAGRGITSSAADSNNRHRIHSLHVHPLPVVLHCRGPWLGKRPGWTPLAPETPALRNKLVPAQRQDQPQWESMPAWPPPGWRHLEASSWRTSWRKGRPLTPEPVPCELA